MDFTKSLKFVVFLIHFYHHSLYQTIVNSLQRAGDMSIDDFIFANLDIFRCDKYKLYSFHEVMNSDFSAFTI